MSLPREVFEKIVYYQREVDRIFSEYLGAESAQCPSDVSLAADVVESDDGFRVDIEIPGVPADAIEVRVSGQLVVIEGDKKETALGTLDGGRFFGAERSYGRFFRVVELPKSAHLGRARASLANGVLSLSVPRLHDRRGQWTQVPVSVAGEGERS